jgi:hypothetical protein
MAGRLKLVTGVKSSVRLPITIDWNNSVVVEIAARCHCGGIMVPGRMPNSMICARSNWFNRTRHTYFILEATVERVENGWP